jgi:hypothetical protein
MQKIRILDNFWGDDFAEFRDLIHSLEFGDIKNPVDGVIYPDIARLPLWAETSVKLRLEAHTGQTITRFVTFARLTAYGTVAPNQAHNDLSMGEYAMVVYINPGKGGTQIVKHKDHGAGVNEWKRDSNEYNLWDVVATVVCEPDRAVIYRADVMHRAIPIKGWGTDKHDGRVVLVTFFDLA